MRFGLMPPNTMNNKLKLLSAAILLVMFGCHHNQQVITITPDTGTAYKAGDAVKVNVSVPDEKVDSIVYLVDSAKVAARKDTTGISFKTDSMKLGVKLITAK